MSEEITVDEVLLDVLVTDRKGNVILGLDENDFVVERDGERVALSGVTFYSNRRFLESEAQAEELGVDPMEVPVDRYFVLFFHDTRQVFPRLLTQQLNAGNRAKQWVRSELLPNDYVAVVSYQYRLYLHQDFTNDSEALTEAIGEATRGTRPERIRPAAEGRPSLFAGISQQELGEVKRIYDALSLIGEGAAAVRGRTNLVLFSLGFGRADSFGFYRPDVRWFPDMVETLNANNVAVYTVDLIPTTFTRGVNVLNNSLSHLASDTGGRYYFNFVSFLSPLEQLSEELNGYYLLSFTADGEKGYSEVKVETVNPEFRVRAREGYRGAS